MCDFTYDVNPEKSLFLEGHAKVGHLNRFSVTLKFQNIQQLPHQTIGMASKCQDVFANMFIVGMIRQGSNAIV